MKNILFLLLLILTSCNRIELFQDEKIYQKFTIDDYKYIPQKYQQQNTVHSFISNSGQIITLNNNFYKATEKVVYPNSTQIIYYDNVYINLKWSALSDCNNIEIDITKSSNNTLYYKLVFWSFENGCIGNISNFNTTDAFEQLQIGGVDYNYVIKLNLNNFFVNVSNSKKINKIYYDLEKGIVGLQNTQTNEEYWAN